MPKREPTADFKRLELARVRHEAAHSAAALLFLLESAGVHISAEFPYSDEGLREVENLYRASLSRLANREQVEYQLGLFLGEVMVRKGLGEWVYYEGKYHVLDPIVVRLSGEQLFVQPLLFCRQLKQKQVMGTLSRQSLIEFTRNASRSAQP